MNEMHPLPVMVKEAIEAGYIRFRLDTSLPEGYAEAAESLSPYSRPVPDAALPEGGNAPDFVGQLVSHIDSQPAPSALAVRTGRVAIAHCTLRCALVLPGRKSGFWAGVRPDCRQENSEITPPVDLRPA